MAQTVNLDPESRGLGLQSVAQIGDFLLLVLNRLDHGREQFAVGNPVGAVGVVLPFDQRQPALGFRSLDGFMERSPAAPVRCPAR